MAPRVAAAAPRSMGRDDGAENGNARREPTSVEMSLAGDVTGVSGRGTRCGDTCEAVRARRCRRTRPGRRVGYLFVAVLGYSRRLFTRASLSQRQDDAGERALARDRPCDRRLQPSTVFFSPSSMVSQFFSECARASSVGFPSCESCTSVVPFCSESSIVTV